MADVVRPLWRPVLLAARPRCTLVRDPMRFLTPPIEGGGDAGGMPRLDVEGGLCVSGHCLLMPIARSEPKIFASSNLGAQL